MKFCVVNLGCKVNRIESDALAVALLAAGGQAVDEADAELVAVNSCTVTGEAEKKTRKAVRHALRAAPEASVVVTGCAAAIDPDTYTAMDPRVRVVPKAALMLLVQEEMERGESFDALPAEDVLVGGSDFLSPSRADGTTSVSLPLGEGFRTRVGVKVQDGCNNACTYCIVHVARGRATSRPADEVVAECVTLARAGAKEIVLTGINLGSYAWPPKGNAFRSVTSEAKGLADGVLHLADLLRCLLDVTADLHAPGEPPCRFRVSSIEPRDVDDNFINLLAEAQGRICRHLHLPLQSGSSKVLREMARPYDAERFCALVERLRERVPQLSLSTDIIVGFPGETEDDFQATLAVSRRCAFSKIHVFPYSRREGTPAASRPDQVEPSVKADRAARLRALSDELRSADLASRKGTIERALVEEGGLAMTESYHELPAPEGTAPGALVELLL